MIRKKVANYDATYRDGNTVIHVVAPKITEERRIPKVKPYHKRLAELYAKYKQGHWLSVMEIRDWKESLDAIYHQSPKRFEFEQLLADIWKVIKDNGQMTGSIMTALRKALDENLDHCFRMSMLGEISLIAYEMQDIDWQHEICAKIDKTLGGAIPS